jgi:hypothetical protein
VEVISRVHHRHLVTLLGYCMKGEERLLVLEYMANGTLESNLHGKFFPGGPESGIQLFFH